MKRTIDWHWQDRNGQVYEMRLTMGRYPKVIHNIPVDGNYSEVEAPIFDSAEQAEKTFCELEARF